MTRNHLGYLHPDGTLRFAKWADSVQIGLRNSLDLLRVNTGPKPAAMAHTTATGQGLITNGHLGVDLIRAPKGGGFIPHTHPGDHLLIVVAGRGTITYGGLIYPTFPGSVYMVEGAVPHAVGAIDDHCILAVGAPHKAVDDAERMKPVEYAEVISDLGDMHCLICNRHSQLPLYPHDVDCPHCPCPSCVPS